MFGFYDILCVFLRDNLAYIASSSQKNTLSVNTKWTGTAKDKILVPVLFDDPLFYVSSNYLALFCNYVAPRCFIPKMKEVELLKMFPVYIFFCDISA